MATSLLVISDREPLAWLLRTASLRAAGCTCRVWPFSGDHAAARHDPRLLSKPGSRPRVGDGVAQVVSAPELLPAPVVFRGREYRIGLSLDLPGVCAVQEGVELVSSTQLSLLPRERPRSYPLRKSVVLLPERDARLISERLEPLPRPVSAVLSGYEHAARLLDGKERAND